MKQLLALSIAALLLASCAGFTAPGSSSNFDINKLLTDPNCAHHDEITGVTGAAGVPASLQFKAVRECPAAPVAAH